MNVRQPWVLEADVEIVPLVHLSEEVLRRTEADASDFAVSRPSSRSPAALVDARAADLLGLFRRPRTMAEAILDFCGRHGLEPKEVLKDAYGLFRRFISRRFLVPADGAPAGVVRPGLAPGDRILDYQVVREVHLTEDVEVYQLRGDAGLWAALKLERTDAAPLAGDLEREALVLRHLDGDGVPRLLDAGELDGRRYLLTGWCPGVDAATAAAEWRHRKGSDSRERLLELCHQIATAYARLSVRGVLQGDVHPRNVVVDDSGQITLLDLALARWVGGPESVARAPRAGVPFYHEPEYAQALLANTEPPPVTEAGEQHAVAALLYYLITGAPYLNFSLERERLLRQIVHETPLRFAAHGVNEPAVEAVLRRALAKEPSRRFPSLEIFCQELAEALARSDTTIAPAIRRGPGTVLARLLDRFLEATRDPEAKRLEASAGPLASVTYGAAGVAYALLRIACQRDDASLLARADLWACLAQARSTDARAFTNPRLDLCPETVGRSSPYHTVSGVFAVQALIAQAAGDPTTQARSVTSFVTASEEPPADGSLSLGSAGTLLVSALLLDSLSEPARAQSSPLRKLGERTLAHLVDDPDLRASIHEAGDDVLGIAHGWAGRIYGALQWCRAADISPPDTLTRRLKELADLAEPAGRGLRWPRRLHPVGREGPLYAGGWCAGSAGFVLLWTLATRLFDEPSYLEFAAGAAYDTWDATTVSSDLCCGLAGQAYSLLSLYKQTGETIWLLRARDLAERAAECCLAASQAPLSLFKGETSLAVLAADLERPEHAFFPFFEEEC